MGFAGASSAARVGGKAPPQSRSAAVKQIEKNLDIGSPHSFVPMNAAPSTMKARANAPPRRQRGPTGSPQA
jgi:hypothetical protein